MNFLQIRELNNKEIKDIFENRFMDDFPKAEQKPLEMMLKLKNEGKYLCYGLFEHNILRGYAYLGKTDSSRNLLLDYFAIVKECRGGGYGSRFIKMLKSELQDYAGLILEVESVEHAVNEKQRQERIRRLSFYYANGLKKTNIETSVKKVVYTVIYYPFVSTWTDEALIDDINALYPVIYYGDYYSECFDYVRLL